MSILAFRLECADLILMYLALEHLINNPEEGAFLLQVDFEKAFDSVNINFYSLP